MLPAIDFDHQPRAMTGEVRDILPKRNLAAESPFRKGRAQHRPDFALGIGHIGTQRPTPRRCAIGWSPLHAVTAPPPLRLTRKRVSLAASPIRSEERRVGKECVRTDRSRW